MDKGFLEKKLRNLPVGFGIEETRLWLKDIPEIISISDIEPFFGRHDLTKDEWFALIVIMRNRYINSMPQNKEFGDSYEQFILKHQPESKYKTVFLSEDKSTYLDFRPLEANKLQLCMIRRCEEIFLPRNLEMLEIRNAPKLNRLKDTEYLEDLKYLSLAKCSKLLDLDFIAGMKQLCILDLGLNTQLPELNFLNESIPVVILQLVGTNVIKYPSTIENLSKLKKLKYLSIKANSAELKTLRERLPDCIINE